MIFAKNRFVTHIENYVSKRDCLHPIVLFCKESRNYGK